MIRVTVNLNASEMMSAVVEVTQRVMNRRGLNQVLADRLSDELVAHFRKKSATPNRLGGERTHFWAQIADATAVSHVDESGAVVTVAESRFAIHLHGGTVRPQNARALTIPLIPAAHGVRASVYENREGVDLFTLKGVPILFQKTQGEGSASIFAGQSGKRKGGAEVSLAPRERLQAVYALVSSVKIPADPDALPELEQIQRALTEEAEDYFERLATKGGSLA